MRSSLLAVAAGLSLAGASPGIAAADSVPESATAKPCAGAQGMFVQTIRSGSFDGKALHLTLERPATLYFADRPQRIAGQVEIARFLAAWGAGPNSFASDPPNASLAFTTGGKPQAAVVELSAPRLEGGTLSYDVRVLEGQVPASFTDASLFIDPGGLMCLVCGCCN